MRKNQQRIWKGIQDITALKPKRLIDKDGDSGAWVIWFNETPELAEKFRKALSAEGIPAWPAHGGVHQFRKITTLLSKKAVTSGGCPWSCPLNKGSNMNYKPDDTPKSNALMDRVVTIPVPPTLTDKDVDDVIKAIRKVAKALL
jgi:dTDP-4-amino-4,6-dideoxygalactose transaminase